MEFGTYLQKNTDWERVQQEERRKKLEAEAAAKHAEAAAAAAAEAAKEAAEAARKAAKERRAAAFAAYYNVITFEQSQSRWSQLKHSPQAAVTFESIPWPPRENVALIRDTDDMAEKRKKVKVALLHWHPDKFVTLSRRLGNLDRAAAEEKVKTIAVDIIRVKEFLGL